MGKHTDFTILSILSRTQLPEGRILLIQGCFVLVLPVTSAIRY